VLILAIDTCDSRGSVAVLKAGQVLATVVHDSTEDYSSWLLPSVERSLRQASASMKEVVAYAAATGPGSFTGVRVGLTAVKAWAEVYGGKIVAVSRLESVAAECAEGAEWVAAFYDAQRGQIFGAVYKRGGGRLEREGDEMVIAPGEFVRLAAVVSGEQKIAWVSMDPGCMTSVAEWGERAARGERVESVGTVRSPMIGNLGLAALGEGRVTDVLALEANYVRRSDAEIYWKGKPA
jgi:tRNA threonylcarbamoyladenosine biosynthesis protein TsaB